MFKGKRMKLVNANEIAMPDGSPPKQLLESKDDSSGDEFPLPEVLKMETSALSVPTETKMTLCHNNSCNSSDAQRTAGVIEVMNARSILPDISVRLCSNVTVTRIASTPAGVVHKKYEKPVPAVGSSLNEHTHNNNKRSHFNADDDKKRDDRRRAAHNEVERRRRDKINNYIAILKDMLPAEFVRNMPSSTPSIYDDGGTGRTACTDSKAHILIRVCDYIKSMESELNKLRECLKENEELRSRNLRLEMELQKVKEEGKASAYLSGGIGIDVVNGDHAGFLDQTLSLLNGADAFAEACDLDECDLIDCGDVVDD